MRIMAHHERPPFSQLPQVSAEVIEKTFAEGMSLVEATAAYLDGPGREESKILPRKVALAYAGESMRLTTRLMQVVSWLLVQRAVRQGEMKAEEAAQERYRLGSREVCEGAPMMAADLLPTKLLELLEGSRKLYEQVSRLDAMIYAPPAAPEPPQIRRTLDGLAAQFGEEE
ncbi:MAG: DUF1465 family protein [Alphaproteobacteria bacterium]|nr:DUF1465 family protein [Alphaproteobacteria bacterium]